MIPVLGHTSTSDSKLMLPPPSLGSGLTGPIRGLYPGQVMQPTNELGLWRAIVNYDQAVIRSVRVGQDTLNASARFLSTAAHRDHYVDLYI
jgi:hypothetical protein